MPKDVGQIDAKIAQAKDRRAALDDRLVRAKASVDRAKARLELAEARVPKVESLMAKRDAQVDALVADKRMLTCPTCQRTLAVHKSLERVVCLCGFSELNSVSAKVCFAYGQVITPAHSA